MRHHASSRLFYLLTFLKKKYGKSDIFCTFAFRKHILFMTVKEFFGKFKAPMLWGNLLAMLAVVVLLCFGVKWWLAIYTHHGEEIVVPSLYGVTLRDAVGKLDPDGLIVVANDSSYVEGLPAGAIIQQNPVPGMKVKSGRVIYVTINSLTMPCERIPDLIDNCSYREAEARLKSLGFVLLTPKLIDGEKDWVYGIQYRGRNVVAGDNVPRESELTLIIGNGSLGEEKDTVETDEFSSDDVDDFLEVLE
jgi:beta-lactam-binding protein with PASTA domain